MNTALWVVTIVLTVAFLAAGLMKATRPKDTLAVKMEWANDFSSGTIKTIGVLEILGALGLVLPALTGIAPILVPLAAVGLALTQAGAIVVHARHGETANIAVNIVLLAMALFVAWGRFGPYAF